MKNLILAFLLISQTAFADLRNPVAFVGEVIFNAVVGAPIYADVNGQLASGTPNLEVSATADTTTTSTTDVLMNSMTITPVAGTYLTFFSTCVDHSNQSVSVTISIYSGGTLKSDSQRPTVPRFNGVGANSLSHCVASQGVVVVNGSQAIEGRWRTAANTATAHQRTLNILRVL